MAYNLYPQTDLNQQNLNWIVSRIKELETLIANGGVKVVTLASDMTNHGVIYVYEGTEAGMNTDHWYYWDNASQTWVDGGGWGGGAVSLPLAVSDGGTGAVNASGARTNLGLGTLAVENDPLAIAKGGTGTTTAAGIRNAIGLGNSTGVLDVTYGGTGQTTKAAIRNTLGLGNTTGALPVANGGTGATSASAALAALGGEPAISMLPINKGGTGANSASGARTALGLGSLALENAPLSVAKGGTGAITAAAALNALLGYNSKNISYTAGISIGDYKDITYDDLGIPVNGTLLMVSMHQMHWAGDDIFHSIFEGFAWDNTARVLHI